MPRWPAVRPGQPQRLRQPHHTVADEPPHQLDGKVLQDPSEAGDVVSGVRDDDDVRNPGLPLARRDEASDDAAELGRRHGGGVDRRAEPDRVQDLAPIPSTATNEYGRPGMNYEAVFARP